MTVFSLSTKEAVGTDCVINRNRRVYGSSLNVHPLEHGKFRFRDNPSGAISFQTVSFQWMKEDRTKTDRGNVAYCE